MLLTVLQASEHLCCQLLVRTMQPLFEKYTGALPHMQRQYLARRRASAMKLERRFDRKENYCCVLAGLSQLQRRQEQLQVQQHANMLRRSRNGSPEGSSGGLMNWGSHLVKVGRLGACTTRRDVMRFFEVFDIDENSIRLAFPPWDPW